MTRRRSMHALLGTLALIAGCSTTHRSEVTGVVRDRSTGRVISGARVIGADGTVARTDVHGRFTLYVRAGRSADVRVSADGHASEHLELAGLEADVDLAPTTFEGDTFVMQSAEHPVLGWTEESWLAIDAGATDPDGGGPGGGDPEPSHVSTWMGDPGDGELGAGAACVGCHGDEGLPGWTESGDVHGGLADSCLACHAPRLGPDASASCARCHGTEGAALAQALAGELGALRQRAWRALDRAILERAVQTSCGGLAARFTQVGEAFVLVDDQGSILGDCDTDGVEDDGEDWQSVDRLGPDAEETVRALALLDRDRSGGVHSPDRTRALLRSLAH